MSDRVFNSAQPRWIFYLYQKRAYANLIASETMIKMIDTCFAYLAQPLECRFQAESFAYSAQKGRQNPGTDHKMFYKPGFKHGKCPSATSPVVPVAAKDHSHTSIREELSTPEDYNGGTDVFSGLNGIFQTHFLWDNIALCYHLHQVKAGIYHESKK